MHEVYANVYAATTALIMIVLVPATTGFCLGRLFPRPSWLGVAILEGGLLATLAYFYFCNPWKGLPAQEAAKYVILSIYAVFAWMFLCMGIMLGSGTKRVKESNEQQLSKWQEQLVKDEAAAGNPLLRAYDLQRIGDLYCHLGQYQKAVEAYHCAYPIIFKELGGHPQARTFLQSYARALRSAGNTDYAASIEREMATVGWEGDLPVTRADL